MRLLKLMNILIDLKICCNTYFQVTEMCGGVGRRHSENRYYIATKRKQNTRKPKIRSHINTNTTELISNVYHRNVSDIKTTF